MKLLHNKDSFPHHPQPSIVQREVSQMGKENSDHPQVLLHHHHHQQSSIALLQERFRQLQREKEVRRERDLLRTISIDSKEPKLSPCYIPNNHLHESSSVAAKLFFQSEILNSTTPTRPPPCEVSLSLWPNSEINNHKTTIINFSGMVKPWINDQKPVFHLKFSGYDQDSDVDTSLHL